MFKILIKQRARACRGDQQTPADLARMMLAGRRALQVHLPAELLHDPSLDMLLSLFVAEADGVAMGSAELSTTTTVGPVIAGRWIKASQGLGLIEEGQTIALTVAGRTAVTAALAAVGAVQAMPDYVRRPRLRMLHRRDQCRAVAPVIVPTPARADTQRRHSGPAPE